jgi:flagellar L-ring protein precursor FlgH
MLVVLAGSVPAAQAQSLWARRDPYSANLFADNRTRYVGDLLTIVVYETTEVEGTEKKELNKESKFAAALAAAAKYAVGQLTSRSGSGDTNINGSASRSFEGTANNSIDRKLADKMTVTVVGVLSNGNLVIEGTRTHQVTHELKVLHVTGVVRPLDIGPYNTIQSQYIAEFRLTYQGHGPESSFTNQGWFSRCVNKYWPF